MHGDDGRDMRLVAVGVAHTPYETTEDAPHQGFADDDEATVEIFEECAHELAGIENTHKLTVVYWAHEADRNRSADRAADGTGDRLQDPDGRAADGPAGGHDRQADESDGAFAGRGPARPNPLSICTCMILDVDGRHIRVRGLDALDGSPVVDLKPALQAER